MIEWVYGDILLIRKSFGLLEVCIDNKSATSVGNSEISHGCTVLETNSESAKDLVMASPSPLLPIAMVIPATRLLTFCDDRSLSLQLKKVNRDRSVHGSLISIWRHVKQS